MSSSLKSYVGRVFALRKRAKITGSLSHKDGSATNYHRSDFGDAVLVLDETNTKVRVFKKDGFAIWIPKYFLLKEITSENEIKLVEVLDTLRTLATQLQGNLSPEEQKRVESAMVTIRAMMDCKK